MLKHEENKKFASPKRVLQFFWKLYMTQKFYFFGLLIVTIIVHVASLIPPLYYKKIIDLISEFTGTDKSILFKTLLPIVIILISIKFFSWAIWRLSDMFIINLETKLMRQTYFTIFNYLHKHSHNFFSNTFGGSLVKQTNKLTGSIENMTDIMIFEILPTLLIIITTIVFISQQSLAIGLLILGWVLIYSILQFFLQRWRMKHDISYNQAETKNSGFIADCITNNTTIRTFGSLNFEFKNFTNIINDWYKKARIARYSHTIIFAFSGLLMFLLDIGSLYWALKLREKDTITVGFFILLQTYLIVIFGRMMFIGNNFRRLSRAISDSGEMIYTLDTPHEIQDVPGAKLLNIKQGEIVFDKVTFTYTKEENSDIFSELSFRIKPGEKVALVGQSGSGKTSIIKLLYRFFDIQGGKILIDGQDISQVKQDSLRGNMSLVPQDPILFHRSLKENISYGNPDATDEEIIAASKMARCHDFISGFTSGYDTLVGERGIKLSGGERQRVAIARAILHNKNILLLDEATSALDSESEQLIQEAMEEVMKNKTVIIVAHRLSTIMKMDRIIVMDQGKIVQSGSHKELLLDKDGIYNKLWSIQSGGFVQE